MSHEEEKLTPGEKELEAALGRLRPAAPRFSLEQAQARAMIDAMRRRTRIWQAVAALLAIAAGAAMILRPGPRTVERVVVKEVPVQVRSEEMLPVAAVAVPVELENGDLAYLKLRDKVLSRGVASLRASRETPAAKSPAMMDETRTGRGGDVRAPWYVDFVSGGRS